MHLLLNYYKIVIIASDAYVKQAVTSWPQTIDTDFFYTRILAKVIMWDKSFRSVLTTWKSGVYHLLPTTHVYNVTGARFCKGARNVLPPPGGKERF